MLRQPQLCKGVRGLCMTTTQLDFYNQYACRHKVCTAARHFIFINSQSMCTVPQISAEWRASKAQQGRKQYRLFSGWFSVAAAGCPAARTKGTASDGRLVSGTTS